jgi:hypothetical protein
MKLLRGDKVQVHRPPFTRLPAVKGTLVLVCRGHVPKGNGRCTPRWHLAGWSKRRPCRNEFRPDEPNLWHFFVPTNGSPWFEHVTRVWSYVRRCGAGRGLSAQEIKYGKPTCKRCLALLAAAK